MVARPAPRPSTATTSTRRARTSRPAATAATSPCPTTRRAPPRADRQVLAQGRRGVRALGGAGSAGSAALVGPLLHEIPPKLGSKRPGDLLGQAKLARQAAQGRRARRVRPDPAVHREHRRPGRGPLRVGRDARRAVSVSGRDRHLGRPAQRRHRVRHAAPPHRRHHRGASRAAAWAGSRRRWRPRPAAFGAEIRTEAPASPGSTSRTGGSPASRWRTATSSRADVVITTAHPKISFLRPGRAARNCRTTSSPTSSRGRAGPAR